MSFKMGAFTGPLHEWERAWPEHLAPADPYSGDEVLDVPGRFDNYVAYGSGELLDEEGHRHWDERFCVIFRAIMAGESHPDELAEAARYLQVDLPRTHDRRPPRVSPYREPDSRLADAVENWVPDVGLLAPDRVLGPWSDEPLPPWLRSLCGKVVSFSPLLSPAVRPVGRECKSPPRPHLDMRRVLIAMLQAPTMLWWTDPVRPALPLSERWTPEGPVVDTPETPAFIGRIYKTPEAWTACCVLPLPHRMDPAPLLARLDLELMRQRRFERRMTWENLLRDRGEVLYRTVCEQLWLRDEEREAASALWSSCS